MASGFSRKIGLNGVLIPAFKWECLPNSVFMYFIDPTVGKNIQFL